MKTELKKEFKLLKNFYIFYFLWGLASFLTAYIIIYFYSIGLSFSKISLLLAIALVAPIIFEVPTGAIADHYGRRISIVIGTLSAGTILLIIPFIKNFWTLAILFFCNMSLSTLVSGSDSAWMVDFLKSKRKQNLIHTAFARVATFGATGALISLILASLIVKYYNMDYLWFAQGGIVLTVGFFTLFFGDKEKIIHKGNFKKAIKNTFGFAKQGFKLIFVKQALFFFVLASFFTAFFSIGGLVWQPLFIDLGIKLEQLGIIFAGVFIVGIFAPMASTKLLKLVKKEKMALILQDLVTGATFIIISLVSSPLIAVLLFYFGTFGIGVGSPIRVAFFQKRIPSKIRATVTSVKHLISASGGIIAVLLAGYIVDNFGLRVALAFGGLAAIPTVICYLMIKDEK
jgi:MFS family permease